MADPTLVNGQITDAVTQANVKILGEAPAQALGTLYQVMAQAVGLSMQNAVASQQQMTLLGTAATTQGINLLFSMDPSAAATGAQDLLTSNSLTKILAELNTTLNSGVLNAKPMGGASSR
ncbi:MAG TPA: RebB family R body protein [Thermoanaerobaculia bacterium]|nr:RebB family R body protein [Thermoanaerobaculia bacterium]